MLTSLLHYPTTPSLCPSPSPPPSPTLLHASPSSLSTNRDSHDHHSSHRTTTHRKSHHHHPPSPSTFPTTSTGALTLFNPAHVPTSHGIPGSTITYRGRPRRWTHRCRDCYRENHPIPDIIIRLPDPQTEGSKGTGLMAHYVWNAGVLGAEMILGLDSIVGDEEERMLNSRDGCQKGRKSWRRRWDVAGQNVLELGAGEWWLSLSIIS